MEMVNRMQQPWTSWQTIACTRSFCSSRVLMLAATRATSSSGVNEGTASQQLQRQAVLQQWQQHKQRRRGSGKLQQPYHQTDSESTAEEAPDSQFTPDVNVSTEQQDTASSGAVEIAAKADRPYKQIQPKQQAPGTKPDRQGESSAPAASHSNSSDAHNGQHANASHELESHKTSLQTAKQLQATACQEVTSPAEEGTAANSRQHHTISHSADKHSTYSAPSSHALQSPSMHTSGATTAAEQPHGKGADGVDKPAKATTSLKPYGRPLGKHNIVHNVEGGTAPQGPDAANSHQTTSAARVQQQQQQQQSGPPLQRRQQQQIDSLLQRGQQQQQFSRPPTGQQQQVRRADLTTIHTLEAAQTAPQQVSNATVGSSATSKAGGQDQAVKGKAGGQDQAAKGKAGGQDQAVAATAQQAVKLHKAKRQSSTMPKQRKSRATTLPVQKQLQQSSASKRSKALGEAAHMKQVLRRLRLMRHRHSVWGLAARVARQSQPGIKPASKQRAGKTASSGRSSAVLRGLDDGARPSLSAEHLLLLRLSRYRPLNMDDTIMQVSHVAPYDRAAWDKALADATSQQLLTSFSLQQLSFITAALAACQHPCNASVVQHVHTSVLSKLTACVQQLKDSCDAASNQAGQGVANVPSLASRGSASGDNNGAATGVFLQGVRMRLAPSVQRSMNAAAQGGRLPKGTSLTLYPAACLAVGLLRMQAATGHQAVHDTMGSGVAATPVASRAAATQQQDEELFAVANFTQKLRKLLLQWFQLSLRLHRISPWNKRRSATWMVNLAWALSALPSYHTFQHAMSHQNTALHGSTEAGAIKLYALPSSIANSISRYMLMRGGWMRRLLDPLSAMRLAAVLGCTTPVATVATTTGLANLQHPHHTSTSDLLQHTTASQRTKRHTDPVTFSGNSQQQTAPAAQSTAMDNEQVAVFLTSPTQQLAVRVLLRQVFSQVGQLSPPAMAAVLGMLATAAAPVVEEAYTPAVMGSRQRQSVSLMQRLSKLVRARVHVLKLRELLVLLNALALLHRRRIALPTKAIPDALMLDELTRWAANKLQDASPSQAVQLLLIVASMRWYNTFWWDKAGRYMLRVSINHGGFSMQQIQQALVAFAAVGHEYGPLLSHFRKHLLRKLPQHSSAKQPRPEAGCVKPAEAAAASVQEGTTPTAMLSALASFVRLGHLHAELYDRLADAALSAVAQPVAAQHRTTLQQGDNESVGTSRDVVSTAIMLAPANVWAALAAGCACLGHVPAPLLQLTVQLAKQSGTAVERAGTAQASRSLAGQPHKVATAASQAAGGRLASPREGQNTPGQQDILPAVLQQQLSLLGDAAYCLLLTQHREAMPVASILFSCLNALAPKQLSSMYWSPSTAAVVMAYTVKLESKLAAHTMQDAGCIHPTQKVMHACIASGAPRGYWAGKSRPELAGNDKPLPGTERQRLLSQLKEALQLLGAKQVVVGQPARVASCGSLQQAADTGSRTTDAASKAANSSSTQHAVDVPMHQVAGVVKELAALMVPDASCFIQVIQPRGTGSNAGSTDATGQQDFVAGKLMQQRSEQRVLHVLLHAGLGLPSSSMSLENQFDIIATGIGQHVNRYNDVLFRMQLLREVCGLSERPVLVPVSLAALGACADVHSRVAVLRTSLARVGWQEA